MKTREEIEQYLSEVQFISPNEPITPEVIQRILTQVKVANDYIADYIDIDKKITLWNPNVSYYKDDLVLYFKTESSQISPDVDKRTFVFILKSLEDNNTSIPNYILVDNVPNFSKTNWQMIHPTSYVLQDMIVMRDVVNKVVNQLLSNHIKDEHKLIGSGDIQNNLIKNDYSNLVSEMGVDKHSLSVNSSPSYKLDTNGIMEYFITYSFDIQANQRVMIDDSRYYYQKSPILDESDHMIFSHKYIEDNLLQVTVNKQYNDNNEIIGSTQFTNLRYGTNVFNKHISFEKPFIDDEYCVFFDTYGYGQFVFGYDQNDIQLKTEPTYDAIVSMPMMMNKTPSGFDIVLPIHTHFNSMQKYNIGVPWKNEFRLQVIGRYR